MKVKFWWAGLAALAVLSLSCGKKSTGSGGGGNPPPSGNTVLIRDNFFNPSSKTVSVGDTVTWSYSANITHTVTSDQTGLFDSGDLPANGTTFTQDFNTAGTFRYYCKYHGGPGGAGMSGTIVVQ